jgi:chromate transporter
MKYLLLFMTFAKIGMFTIGGGYAMIPLIEREIVKKRWMSKEDFMEMFALTQSLPGVFAVNISIFVGYKLHKVKGSLVCALATILPSFVIMMLIAMFFAHFQDNQVMIRIFNGIRPAVVALIVIPCISAARALKLKYWQLVLPAIATILIWQFGLSPVYIVLAAEMQGITISATTAGRMPLKMRIITWLS